MIGVELSEGSHTVSLRYRNGAYSAGWKVSLGCAAVFLLLVQVVYRPDWSQLLGRKNSRGRFEK